MDQPMSPVEKKDFAYELKFLVSNHVADAALAWARTNLVPDPNADGTRGDTYAITSLYFDTTKLDVFHRVGSYGRCKYRVRRYGEEEAIFLERKLKTRGLVGKRRLRIPAEELDLLTTAEASPEWLGYWFHRRILARQLLPTCQISYERVARMGMSNEGPIRITMDRKIRSLPTSQLEFEGSSEGLALLTNETIIELKYRKSLPGLFKNLIQELALNPQPVSKYRLSIEAFSAAKNASLPTAVIDPRNGVAVPGHESSDISPRIVMGNPASEKSDV
jgi:hypothetical protein